MFQDRIQGELKQLGTPITKPFRLQAQELPSPSVKSL